MYVATAMVRIEGDEAGSIIVSTGIEVEISEVRWSLDDAVRFGALYYCWLHIREDATTM